MSHRININIIGFPVIGVNTHDILKVEYYGFRPGDAFDISIMNSNGSLVYHDSGSLIGTDNQIISVDWTPSEMGKNSVEVMGQGEVIGTTIF